MSYRQATKRKVTEAELFEKDWDGKRQTRINREVLLRPAPVSSPVVITTAEFDALTAKETKLEDYKSTEPVNQKEQKVSKKSFRLQGKRFFLTFPQCGDLERETAFKRLDVIAPVKWCVIGREKHMDGENHLHIAVEFKDKYSTRRSDCFDSVGSKHGNYKPMRNMRKCIEYCVKEDTEFFEMGIYVSDFLNKQNKGVNMMIAKMLKDGKTLKEVNEEHSGYVLANVKKIREYQQMLKGFKITNKPELEWKGCYSKENISTNTQIAHWLNKNLGRKRTFKQAQLYVHGPKNMGKTTMVENLRKYFRVYDIPVEDFYDFYDDEDWDIAVLDEFKGQKTIQWLNLFLQGNMMTLRKKGGQLIKLKNIPVIILSNFSVDQAYGKVMADRLESLQCRLEIIEIVDPIDLGFNSDETVPDEEEEGGFIKDGEGCSNSDKGKDKEEENMWKGIPIEDREYDGEEELREEARQIILGTGMRDNETEAAEMIKD